MLSGLLCWHTQKYTFIENRVCFCFITFLHFCFLCSRSQQKKERKGEFEVFSVFAFHFLAFLHWNDLWPWTIKSMQALMLPRLLKGFAQVYILWPVSRLLGAYKHWFVCVRACVCPHCSSGIKRLPFSDDEFASPPSKIAREEEPKKGTADRTWTWHGHVAARRPRLTRRGPGGKISVWTCVCPLSLSLPLCLCHVTVPSRSKHMHVLSALSDRTKYQCQTGHANTQTTLTQLLRNYS